MNIDPSTSIKDIAQEFYNKGYYEGIEEGKKLLMKEMQPSLTFHGSLCMSSIPNDVNIKLDKKAEICFNYDKESFKHCMNVYSFQPNYKKIAIYSTSLISRDEIGDIVKYSIDDAIKKDYYNSNARDFETYMKGIF